jgi:hypothetical protein
MGPVLDGSGRGGFSAWRKRPACRRQREAAQLTQELRQGCVAPQQRDGSPRRHAELNDQGRTGCRKRVARLMREADLGARRKRRRVVTTTSPHHTPSAPPCCGNAMVRQAHPTNRGGVPSPLSPLPRDGSALLSSWRSLPAWWWAGHGQPTVMTNEARARDGGPWLADARTVGCFIPAREGARRRAGLLADDWIRWGAGAAGAGRGMGGTMRLWKPSSVRLMRGVGEEPHLPVS